jgi:release factor glutamine methyltransferase
MEIFYNSLKLTITDTVYAPAEDSYMLADAAFSAGSVLEIGCGSGIVSLSWARSNAVTGVDINPDAVELSKENALKNNLQASFIQSDLFSNVNGKFDVILFNPPYLPTDRTEQIDGKINHAFDGGTDGRIVLNSFLRQFEKHLKPDGKLFLIQSSLNDYDQTIEQLHELGFNTNIVEKHEFFFEKLYLIVASK